MRSDAEALRYLLRRTGYGGAVIYLPDELQHQQALIDTHLESAFDRLPQLAFFSRNFDRHSPRHRAICAAGLGIGIYATNVLLLRTLRPLSFCRRRRGEGKDAARQTKKKQQTFVTTEDVREALCDHLVERLDPVLLGLCVSSLLMELCGTNMPPPPTTAASPAPAPSPSPSPSNSGRTRTQEKSWRRFWDRLASTVCALIGLHLQHELEGILATMPPPMGPDGPAWDPRADAADFKRQLLCPVVDIIVGIMINTMLIRLGYVPTPAVSQAAGHRRRRGDGPSTSEGLADPGQA